MKKILRFRYILLALIIVAVWQYFANSNIAVRLYISSPILIMQYFAENYVDLLRAFLITFIEAISGLIIATIFSFGVMTICFYKTKFLDFILPIMISSQVVPVIVLAPFFIIFFGLGLASKIAMAAVISFFPIFVNFVQGYKAIPVNILELMSIYQADMKFRIRHVYFPLAMPSIMAGLKVSATLSVIGAIVAEFTGAKLGIGKNLFVSAIRLNPDLMMSSVILAAGIGLILYSIINQIEKKYGQWYLASRNLNLN